MLANYDVQLSDMGNVIYRFWGATLIGMGLMTWVVRSIDEPRLRLRIVLSLFIATSLSTWAAVLGQLAGSNMLGWSVVATYALCSVVLLILAARLRTSEASS